MRLLETVRDGQIPSPGPCRAVIFSVAQTDLNVQEISTSGLRQSALTSKRCIVYVSVPLCSISCMWNTGRGLKHRAQDGFTCYYHQHI